MTRILDGEILARLEPVGATPWKLGEKYETNDNELGMMVDLSQAISLKRIANALERLEKKPSVGLNAEDIYQMTCR